MSEQESKQKVLFEQLPPSAYQHPADKVALEALKKVPFLDELIKHLLGGTVERSIRLQTLASAVRTSKKQFKKVYDLHVQACDILDIKQVPELYIAQVPTMNAFAVGFEKPFIALHSGLVGSLTPDELQGVIGHELAHISSGHMLYKTLLRVLLDVGLKFLKLPITEIALMGIMAALREWDRKSELTADRAELLVIQDPETAVHLHMKLAGGNYIEEMNLEEFIAQAEEYNANDSLVDTYYKLGNTVWQSHPFAAIRVLELIKWVRSGEYDQLMRGDFSRAHEPFSKTAKEAAKGYADKVKDGLEPLKKNVENMKNSTKDFLDKFFKKPKK